MPVILHIDPITVDDLEMWNIRYVKLFLRDVSYQTLGIARSYQHTPVAQIRMSSLWIIPSPSTTPSGIIF